MIKDTENEDNEPQSHILEHETEDLEAYIATLGAFSGFYILNPLSCFITDFNFTTKDLNFNKCLFVQRFGKQFANNDCHWVYICSCDSHLTSLLSSLSDSVDMTFNEFEQRITHCLHVQASKEILLASDQRDDLLPEMHIGFQESEEEHVSDPVYLLSSHGNSNIVCVVDHFLGVVRMSDPAFCLSCCNNDVCTHLKKLNHIIETGEDLPDFLLAQPTQRAQRVSLPWELIPNSKLRIPFDLPPNLRRITFDTTEASVPLSHDGAMLFIPEIPESARICPDCSACWNEFSDPEANNWLDFECLYFSRRYIFPCRVFYRPCTQCPSKLRFDGLHLGVLNMRKFIISYDVLRDFMFHFLMGRCTLSTYYSVWKQAMLDANQVDFERKMSYNWWRFAWYGFLDLLDIDYAAGFCCPTCGTDNVDCVICDGTSLGFRQELCSAAIESLQDSMSTPHKGSSHSDRVYFKRKCERTSALSLCNGSSTSEDSEAAYEVLAGYPEFCLFVRYAYQSCLVDGILLPGVITFIKALSKNSPVCTLITSRPEALALCKELSQGEHLKNDLTKMTIIQNECPIIFKLIGCFKENHLPEAACLLLTKLIAIAEKPFTDLTRPADEEIYSWNTLDELTWFPSLPKQRKRGIYRQDKQKTNNMEHTCNKRSTRHPTLLPGIFLLHCKHGITYGFSVTASCESPNVPFTILRTRFTRAPTLIVYDNACNLHTYSLNRDPVFFKDSRFVVDRLHWRDHKGCSEAYDLSQYPGAVNINSQIAEQRNSSLKRIQGSLSYMTNANFMKHCKFYLWYRNRCVISKMLS